MTQEPLWASSLATLPRPDEDERVEGPPREPDEPAPEPHAPASYRRALPVVLIALVVGVALSFAESDSGGGPLEVRNVSSSWGNVQMRCDTVRFETPRRFGGSGPRALEIFECTPLGNGVLPPGDYSSPNTVWNSDIDERQAIANRIDITDNVVLGWARY